MSRVIGRNQGCRGRHHLARENVLKIPLATAGCCANAMYRDFLNAGDLILYL